jgi:hypothetical protein
VLKLFPTVGGILSLSAATALAEPDQFKQQSQVASAYFDLRNFDQIGNHHQFAAGGAANPATVTGRHAARPVASDQEPESISRGTEP